MQSLLTTAALISLLTLTLPEAVLGLDNIIFITIVAGKLPVDQRKSTKLGAGYRTCTENCFVVCDFLVYRIEA